MNGFMQANRKEDFELARRDFRKLQQHAFIHGLFNRLLRRPTKLCSFESDFEFRNLEVKEARQLQEVCLADICGSVGRAKDYTATFLPRKSTDENRWARARIAVDSGVGVPPLELFELEGRYYIKDGHQRGSVLKHLNVRYFEAYVTKFKIKRPDALPATTKIIKPVIQVRYQPCNTNV